MIMSAVVGAWLGAGVVASLPKRRIQLGMGGALLIAALLMAAFQFDLKPEGAEALGLELPRLVPACLVIAMLGALMTIGVGLYAPCMILVSLMGMNPIAAFPIMMGACAFLMPVASTRFVLAGKLRLRAAIGLTLGGLPAVLIAALVVKSLPLYALKWLVVAIVLIKTISPNPKDIGFDYHFLMPATGDRVPCVYFEQGLVVGLDPADPIEVSYGKRIGDEPSGAEARATLKQDWSHGHKSTIVNGIFRIGWMTGGQKARWVDEDMADVFTEKALAFLERANASSEAPNPWFLFFSTHDIHVPRVPHSRFTGKSGLGPRGDAMVQADWCVGQLLDFLDEHGLVENTLVIFGSDNGPVLDDGYKDDANEKLGDHDPNGPWRAGKYSLFEGGTRTPFLVRWPARIRGGQTSDALFGQIDLARSFARLTGATVPAGACPDSRDELDTLLGEDKRGRPHLVHEARALSLRLGPWKFVPPGKTREQLGPWKTATIETPGALFETKADRSESKDLAGAKPEKLEELEALLRKIRQSPDRGE